MIVKILKPSKTFAGISYNENKNEIGKSELLAAANFEMGMEQLKKSDYIRYMDLVSSSNPKVQNKQFHAVISCKGQENSPEQLLEIGTKYLEKMGYGNNPYLIYFHSDTENNHIHLVSTRVDKNGVKVSDKMERVRSQRIMNEILSQDLNQKATGDLEKSMGYSFSGVNQFKLLLEKQGWKVSEKDGFLRLHKGGEKQGEISLADVTAKSASYVPDQDRKKQVTALLNKYKQGLSHDELAKLMASKFGIELVFHKGKGHVTPYGYTVIDHNFKAVYKGGEVMDLKQLLVTPERQAKIANCSDVVDILLKEGHGMTAEAFKMSMADYGYRFDYSGKIGLKGDKNFLLSLNEERLKELRYNSRLQAANGFNISSQEEARILSRVFFVKSSDIGMKAGEGNSSNHLYYRDMMNGYLHNSSDIKQEMKDRNISFVSDKGTVYLIDKENKRLVSSDMLGIDLSKGRSRNGVEIVDSSQLEAVKGHVENDKDLSRGKELLQSLKDIVSQHFGAEQESRIRRKRKNDNNNNN